MSILELGPIIFGGTPGIIAYLRRKKLSSIKLCLNVHPALCKIGDFISNWLSSLCYQSPQWNLDVMVHLVVNFSGNESTLSCTSFYCRIICKGFTPEGHLATNNI